MLHRIWFLNFHIFSKFSESSTEQYVRTVTIIHIFRQWEDAEMLYLLQQMYTDLNLIEIFNIEVIFGISYLKFCYVYM